MDTMKDVVELVVVFVLTLTVTAGSCVVHSSAKAVSCGSPAAVEAKR